MENIRLRRFVARTRTERLKAPSSSFCASFGRTHNEGGGSLPPGRATRIPLTISALGVFRVVKTTTLISVKQLIHSHLKVALQNAETLTFCFHVNLFLRFSWAKVRNHKKTRQYASAETLTILSPTQVRKVRRPSAANCPALSNTHKAGQLHIF